MNSIDRFLLSLKFDKMLDLCNVLWTYVSIFFSKSLNNLNHYRVNVRTMAKIRIFICWLRAEQVKKKKTEQSKDLLADHLAQNHITQLLINYNHNYMKIKSLIFNFWRVLENCTLSQ